MNDLRNEGVWDEIRKNRNFMKCPDFKIEMSETDQEKGMQQPPLNNQPKGDIIEISARFDSVQPCLSYTDLLDTRRSERFYDKNAPMSQDQLAFLLWSTQGIQKIEGNNYAALRPAPSGGARHSFETYFTVRNVEGLAPGLYHYLPLEHVGEKCVSVEYLKEIGDYNNRISEMLAGQKWASSASIVIFISCVAYRAEWRYKALAHRVVLIDLGHVGQNLMLSACAMGLGSCCVAAYDQSLCDELLGLDGFEEYTVYACPVGKPAKHKQRLP